MQEKVIIIGAGVYGLALGCYLQMNDFQTEIFEAQESPGGLCTAWKRDGYTFDACIHWLMGSGESSNLHEAWKELHAVQGRQFHEWDVYAQVRTTGGEAFTVYTDPAKLEAEMLRIAPVDGQLVRGLCADLRRLADFDFPITTDKMSLAEKLGYALRFARLAPVFGKWSATNIEGLCSRLHSPVLREALGVLFGGDALPDFPVSGMLMMLAFMHKKSAGYPIGGSLEFARAIERRFLGLGGKIRYRSRVEAILVEEDTAVGVLSGGLEHRADIVVSSADGHATLFDMLGGKYLSPQLREAYEKYSVFPSLIYVSLGVARELRDLPPLVAFPLEDPIELEGGALRVRWLSPRIFNFDPTLAPTGKTAVTVTIPSRNLAYWQGLRERDPDAYREEKRRTANAVIEALESGIGSIRQSVEVVDVATPATWYRYTGNWHGSFEGFLPTRKTLGKNLGFVLPGLANFYMDSQWVSVGGGLPPAAINGRALAKMLCRKYGRRFRTVD